MNTAMLQLETKLGRDKLCVTKKTVDYIYAVIWLSTILAHPTCIWRPIWGPPLEFHDDPWHQHTRVTWLSCSAVVEILGLL